MSVLANLSVVMPQFVVTGSAAAGEPTAAQRRAKLVLFQHWTPGVLPAVADVSRRRRYTLDVFGSEPQHGRTATLRVRGRSATARPKIYLLGVSYSPQVDTTVSRFTVWDSAQVLADKLVKGIILEVDTRGKLRTVQIEGDGTVRRTIEVLSSGRRVLQFSFSQFRARMLRLRATDQQHWRLYKYQWIFDEEPLQLTRWETQPITHGISGFHSVVAADISYSALAAVTLELTAFQRRGDPLMRTYELEATGGVDGKRVAHVQPHALQGLLWKYAFASSSAWHLYREESAVWVQAWGAQDVQRVQPFGTDDLDKVRDMDRVRDVGGVQTAARMGGGSGV
jgi:hypothetical protein